MNAFQLHSGQRGVTLIELMIGLAISAALLMAAMPSFQTAIQNAQIRTAAESVINGLQLARAEAVRRNRPVRFRLTNQSGGSALMGGTDWIIHADDLSATMPSFTVLVQQRDSLEGSANARIGLRTTPDFATAAAAGANMPADIVFNGLGRLTAGTTIRQIDITFNAVPAARRLAINLQTGGDFRLCDPALALSANLQGCSG